MEKVKSQEYDNDWIKDTWGWDDPHSFVESLGKNMRPRVMYAIKIANMTPNMRVLDVGCGRGEVVLYCARNNIHAVGIDYSVEAINLAERTKERHNQRQKSFMQFIHGDLNDVTFKKRFDRIFLLDLIEHLTQEELQLLLRKCKELLSDNGMIVIHTLPNKWLYDVFYKRIIRLFMFWLPADPRSEKEKSIHINEMSIVKVHDLLTSVGFEHRVWLKDMIVEQAKWHQDGIELGRRGVLYKALNNKILGIVFKLLTMTPLKLLIVNDIFAIGWKEKKTSIKLPSNLTERFVFALRS